MTANTENTVAANAVVIVDTIPLVDTLLKFKKIIPINSGRVILRGIRMEAQGNFLVLYGTNLDVDLRYNLESETSLAPSWKEGFPAVVANYMALCGAFKAIRDKRARIEFRENHLLISDNAGNNQMQVPCVGAIENFPEPSPRQDAGAEWGKTFASMEKYIKEKPEQVESHRANHFSNFQEFFIASGDIAAALRYVLPGIAKGDTRYALNGVYMTGSARGVDFVSSNTHVLYKHQARIRGTLPENVGFILPPALADWLAKSPCDDVFSVKTDTDRIFVSGVGFEITGRRIDGKFPRYNDVIPAHEQMPGRLTVDRKTLLTVLRAAKSNTDDNRGVTLAPDATGNALLITTEREGVTTYSTVIPAASRKWLRQKFCVDFLIDFLTTHPGDTVTFDPHRPEKNDPVAVHDGDRLFLQMPINPEGIKPPTAEELEAYRAALMQPDQDFPAASTKSAATIGALTKRPPAFKAVVARAKADPGYLSALLSALGVQAAAV